MSGQFAQEPRRRVLERHPDPTTFQFSGTRVEVKWSESDTFKLCVICFRSHAQYYTGMSIYTPLVLSLCAATALAQRLAPTDEQRLRERLKTPLVYSVPGMDRVQVTRGLVYRTEGSLALQMDVYRPPDLDKNDRRPAVLFLHGGVDLAWSLPPPTEWGIYQSYGRLMGASGLIGVTFNQRIGDPNDGLRKGFSDVEAAIQYVRAHAADLQVDPERLCLAAYSAGGPLLAVAMRDPPPYVRCLVGFYAVLDVRPPVSGEREPFSPFEQLKLHAEKLPPILIARAGQDSPGLNGTIDRFVAEATSHDVAIELHNLKGAPHAFDAQTPTAEVRGVIARTIAFMKANLGK